MKPKVQPCPRQDSRQAKDAGAARSRKEIWPTSVSAHDDCTGSCSDAGKANTNDKTRMPLPYHAASCVRRGVEAP